MTITPSRAELLASLTAEEKIRIVGEYFAQALLAVGQIPAILAKAQERVSFSETLSTVKAFKTETAPAVEKPTRVLMHSFLPGQEHDIRQKAKDFKLELVFTKNDSSRVETPASCSWCVMMRKTSHADYHKLKGGVGSDRLRVVDGITGAMKALADINSLVGTGVK